MTLVVPRRPKRYIWIPSRYPTCTSNGTYLCEYVFASLLNHTDTHQRRPAPDQFSYTARNIPTANEKPPVWAAVTSHHKRFNAVQQFLSKSHNTSMPCLCLWLILNAILKASSGIVAMESSANQNTSTAELTSIKLIYFFFFSVSSAKSMHHLWDKEPEISKRFIIIIGAKLLLGQYMNTSIFLG